MPKLSETKPNEIYTLAKATIADTYVGMQNSQYAKVKFLNWKVRAIILIAFFVSTAILISVFYVIPKTTKEAVKKQEIAFEYPVSVEKIIFPNDTFKVKFLENLDNAKKERDLDKRYGYLELDFEMLLGFYSQTGSYDYRVQLLSFRDYVRKNYSEKYEKNSKLYDFACIDALCAKGDTPDEIKNIKEKLLANGSVDKDVRDGILRNFTAASVSKGSQATELIYINELSSLYSEFERTKDEEIKGAYLMLKDYIVKNYKGVNIPKEINLE